jgi:hypothetical protein
MSEETTELTGKEPRKVLTLDDLHAAPPTQEYTVAIPGLGGDVVIRNLTHEEVRQIYDRNTKRGEVNTDGVERTMIFWASVNPKLPPPEYDVLVKKNAAIIRQIIAAILDVSGLTPDALETAKARFRV